MSSHAVWDWHQASSIAAGHCLDVLDWPQTVKLLMKLFTSIVKDGCQDLFLADAEVHQMLGCQEPSDV